MIFWYLQIIPDISKSLEVSEIRLDISAFQNKCHFGTPYYEGSPMQRQEYHYGDVIMGTMASQITALTIVYSTVYSGADQRKHQSSASLVFVRGIHRWPVNSPHKGPVTRKIFPFDDVIMFWLNEVSTMALCLGTSSGHRYFLYLSWRINQLVSWKYVKCFRPFFFRMSALFELSTSLYFEVY